MRVIAVRTLREFWAEHADAEQPWRAWYREVRKADWKQPIDITSQYANARIIGNDRAIFNIKGNDYRLVVAIGYDKGLVFIRFIGAHREYDHIDALTVYSDAP
jgi:mRNA interferase HigB